MVGEEGEADAVGTERLYRGSRRDVRRRDCLRGIELVGMQPDDPRNAASRNILGFEADFDVEHLVVHVDHPASEVIAICGSDELCRWAISLHPWKREKAIAFGLVELDGRGRRFGQFNSLDLVVGDKRTLRHGRLEPDAILIDFRDG